MARGRPLTRVVAARSGRAPEPAFVFFALRDDDEDDVAARREPLLAIILLAGMAAVLATPTAADLLDNPEYDAVLVAIWAFIAGGSTDRSGTS